MEGWKILLEAKLPKSFQSTKASVKDENEGINFHQMRFKLMAAGPDVDNEYTGSSHYEAPAGRHTLH